MKINELKYQEVGQKKIKGLASNAATSEIKSIRIN